ncbi:Response regulator PleD [Rubripirellula lacrimiformis]|uniref:diguanylate cyclase n=1 Tax=Rubripirellula lacrimiformis TaxID=1930273 RepID=A0A517NJM5_9BACT|nr:diguanylate cyclase [Rubripirellula lacrimiformis]QDT07334.1 Response regulator PleD [Rubripirellula lacrimiformis]
MTISIDPVERPRVLVVDDHFTTRKLMTAWLEMSGYTVVQAEDGGCAWDSAKTNCPPIVVTDWNMPNMSGLELCRSIRQQHGNDDIYVLIATARDTGDDLSAAMEAGANDFLSKPIREEEFLARIRSAEIALNRLQEKTALAELDSLTGLLNQRSFKQRAQRSCEISIAAGNPVSCILLDIDHFKQFNDQYGHATGDEVLRIVSDVISEHVRQTDHACRLGGDEFAVLLHNVSEQDAMKFANRIRKQIALQSCNGGNQSLRVRTTLGVATTNSGDLAISSLIEQADSALLAAKVAGRDRALSTSDLQRNEQGKLGQQSTLVDRLREIHADEVMTKTIGVFRDSESLDDARELFLKSGIDCACVVNVQSELVGMVSERDFMNTLTTQNTSKNPLSSVMNNNITRFPPRTSLAVVWDSLQRNPMLRAVIVDNNGFPLGLVTRRAVLEAVHRLVQTIDSDK